MKPSPSRVAYTYLKKGSVQRLLEYPKGLRITPEEWLVSKEREYLEGSLEALSGDGWKLSKYGDYEFNAKKGKVVMTIGMGELSNPRSFSEIRSFIKLQREIEGKMIEAAKNSYGDMFYSTIYNLVKSIVGRSKGKDLGHSYAIAVAKAEGIHVHS